MTVEPEHTADDGTIRKTHYGTGKQPWDKIVELGWGPQFAAANVLKYLRRTKDVEDSRRKARWYYDELKKLAHHPNSGRCLGELIGELTHDEWVLLIVKES